MDSEDSDLVGFKDAKSIREYARDAFRWACGAGISAGTGDGRLCPNETASHEQLAMLLYRYSQLPKVEVPALEETAAQEPATDSVTESA